VEGGDILFMQPETLHHVETLEYSILFNIDWHSKKSVTKGLFSIFMGAPRKNIYYNFLWTSIQYSRRLYLSLL
jgi:hypothetical protein